MCSSCFIENYSIRLQSSVKKKKSPNYIKEFAKQPSKDAKESKPHEIFYLWNLKTTYIFFYNNL